MMQIDNDTPLVMLTVGQLKDLFNNLEHKEIPKEESKNYVYGIMGIQKIFNCSRTTANRIKSSGKIDAAIKQVGRKIIIDADYAIQLLDIKN